jgi:hypothetical protein
MLNSNRLTLLVVLSGGLGLALLIWIINAVTRNNCCPLVRPVESGWLVVSPLYNPWPLALAVGLTASVWYIGTDRRKADFGYLLLSFFLALFLGIGVVHLSLMVGTYANVMLDNSPPQTHRTEIIEKRADPHQSKLPTMYFMIATDWHAERGTYIQFQVSFDAFQTIEVGNLVQVTTRPGFLGHEWLSQIDPD